MSSQQPNQHVNPVSGAPDLLDADAMKFLASIQQRLAQAQASAAELKAREEAAAETERQLSARKAEVESYQRELAAKQNQLDAKAASVADREQALARAQAQVEERRTQIERAETESTRERERLIEEAKGAQQRIQQQAKAEADALLAQAAREREAAEQQQAQAQQSAQQAQERAAKAAQAEAELNQREQQIARESSSLAAQLQQAEKAAAELAAREKAAKALADAAEKATQQHAATVAKFEQERTKFESRLAELVKNEKALKSSEAEAKAARQSDAQRKAELDRRESAINSREEQLRSAQDEVERQRVNVIQTEAQATQLEATSRHLREQAEQIKASSERQVAQWQDKATEAQFQADSALQQVQKITEQLAAAQARARALEEEMDQVKVLGVNLSPEAQGRVDGLTRRAEAAEKRAATLQEIIDQHCDEVAKAETRYDNVHRQLEEAHQAMRKAGDANAQRIELLQKQLETVHAESSAARRVQAEAEHTLAEANRLRAQNAELVAGALKAQERAEKLEAAVKKQEAELAELRATTATAQAGAGSEDGFSAEQRRRLEAELTQREEALSVLANRLLHSEERTVAMQGQLDRLGAELAEWEAKAANGQIYTDAGGVVHQSSTPEVAVSDSRRRRLRRVRDLLAQEHRKVLLAKEALSRHKAEADSVLQQRARLSQIAQSLQAAEIDANKARAKSGASTVVIAAMMTLLAVSGVSYLAATVLWPSAYAARATVAAESDGRVPTDQQKRVWMAAHERLATDPQVFTLAAEQFGQRGMRELANHGAVQERFGNALALITDVPGQVTFELRGVGREETARELETFVGALSAIANSRREVRTDGMSTVVSKPAEAGKDALDNKRQSAMLGAMGAGLIAAWGAGFGVYRLLARSRKPQPGVDPLDAYAPPLPAVGRIGIDRQTNAAA